MIEITLITIVLLAFVGLMEWLITIVLLAFVGLMEWREGNR